LHLCGEVRVEVAASRVHGADRGGELRGGRGLAQESGNPCGERLLELTGTPVAGDDEHRGAGGTGTPLPQPTGGLHSVDTAGVHDRGAVGEAFGFLEMVRGEDHGDAAVPEGAEEIPGPGPGFRIQAGGGFVEEDHPRIVEQGAGEVEASLLTTGERTDADAGAVTEVHLPEDLVDGPRSRAGARPHAHRLCDGEFPGQSAGLEHDAQFGADQVTVLLRVVAEDGDGATGGGDGTFDGLQGGGLAGPVGAGDASKPVEAFVTGCRASVTGFV